MGAGLNKYRIGIVGCGNISGTHAVAIENTERGALVAAHSRNKSNLDTFCNRYGTEGFSDYNEFLTRPDLDIVVVCTPSGTHLDYGEPAAQAGKHVIVEKPIEISLERGQALIDSCRKNGVQLAVIYQNRFIDGVKRMKQVVDDGEIGKIFMVDASVKWFRDQEYYDSAVWRGTLDLDGGGVVINQSIHTIDLMLWFCGELESIHAYKGTFTHRDIEGEDNAVAALQFKNGTIGVFSASTSVVPPMNRKIIMYGAKGTVTLDGDDIRLVKSEEEINGNEENKSGSGSSSPLAGMTANSHKKQYDQVLDAFYNDKEPVVTGEESLKSLAFVEALYESADRHKAIRIDDYLKNEKAAQGLL